MSRKTLNLDDRLYDYLLANSLREPEVLTRLRTETAELPLAVMQIAPEQGQFMALLIELTGARRALEIGAFTGRHHVLFAYRGRGGPPHQRDRAGDWELRQRPCMRLLSS